MPAKVSEKMRPTVTAGLANDVELVNQYAAPMYAPTAGAASAPRPLRTSAKISATRNVVATTSATRCPGSPGPWWRSTSPRRTSRWRGPLRRPRRRPVRRHTHPTSPRVRPWPAAPAQEPVGERDDGVEVGARDRSEHAGSARSAPAPSRCCSRGAAGPRRPARAAARRSRSRRRRPRAARCRGTRRAGGGAGAEGLAWACHHLDDRIIGSVKLESMNVEQTARTGASRPDARRPGRRHPTACHRPARRQRRLVLRAPRRPGRADEPPRAPPRGARGGRTGRQAPVRGRWPPVVPLPGPRRARRTEPTPAPASGRHARVASSSCAPRTPPARTSPRRSGVGRAAVDAASAGTHPGDEINPGAVAAAARHGLTLPRVAPAPARRAPA